MRNEFQYDIVNIIDLEATCWSGEVPAGQRSEIIEVGIVELVIATGAMTNKTSIMVKPKRSEVSEFCTELTGITSAKANAGVSFDAACMRLRKEFASRERVFASWGDYDRVQFERQCKADGVPYPFGRTHTNVLALANLKWRRSFESIADALALCGEQFEGRLHSGADDAFNGAKVLRKILCVDANKRFAELTARFRQAFVGLSPEEIESLVDGAVASVRAEKANKS